jgi:ATP-dependent DNA helicase RecG
MRSRTSSTVDINWSSPLTLLTAGRKPSPTIEKLQDAGVETLSDLLWILPLRIHKTPSFQPFFEAQINQFFKGSGKVLHVEVKPAFGRRGKGNILLYNGYVVLKDDLSQESIGLRWFNLYPNQKKQIEGLSHIAFLGQIQEFKAQRQVINPQIINTEAEASPYIIEYPTVNKIAGNHLRKVIALIPPKLWESIPETLPELGYNSKLSLGEAFKTIHGKLPPERFQPKLKDAAEERLVYEEFLIDQLKIQTRRKFIKRKAAPIIALEDKKVDDLVKHLPFELTTDQHKVFREIITDFKSGHPMMRMVQGDVGCGKTIVAFLAARVANKAGFQVALMCPTEALANQHFESFKELNPA